MYWHTICIDIYLCIDIHIIYVYTDVYITRWCVPWKEERIITLRESARKTNTHRETKRERERKRERVCACLCVCMYVCVCVWVSERERARARREGGGEKEGEEQKGREREAKERVRVKSECVSEWGREAGSKRARESEAIGVCVREREIWRKTGSERGWAWVRQSARARQRECAQETKDQRTVWHESITCVYYGCVRDNKSDLAHSHNTHTRNHQTGLPDSVTWEHQMQYLHESIKKKSLTVSHHITVSLTVSRHITVSDLPLKSDMRASSDISCHCDIRALMSLWH